MSSTMPVCARTYQVYVRVLLSSRRHVPLLRALTLRPHIFQSNLYCYGQLLPKWLLASQKRLSVDGGNAFQLLVVDRRPRAVGIY